MRYVDKSFSVAYMGKAYGDGWDRVFKSGKGSPMREWNGAKLRIDMTCRGYSEHRFHVELVEGEWPPDNDLVTLCDGDAPPDARHFGGSVAKAADGRSAEVVVYKD